MTLELAVRHRFAGFALDAAFAAPAGITVLFGPSGCGKSTLIAAIAGLLRPDRATIACDGVVLADTDRGVWLPPERRRAGVVFQDARLFPHLNVAGNLRFGLRRTSERRIGFDAVVDLLGLAPLLPRRPHGLSGGERQLVAIGRALLCQPRVLLMDEPLASLDTSRRAEILPYLARLPAALALPILYVTHATDELARLADGVVLMEAGRVIASGPLDRLASRPDLALARRDDAGAILACTVQGDAPGGLTRLAWGHAELLVPRLACPTGRAVRVRIPAREVILGRPEVAGVAGLLSLHNILPGRVVALAADPARASALVEIAAGGGTLLAQVTEDAVDRLGLIPGAAVCALIKSVSVEVLARSDRDGISYHL